MRTTSSIKLPSSKIFTLLSMAPNARFIFSSKELSYLLILHCHDCFVFLKQLVLGLMTTHRHDGSLEEEDREEKEKIILESKKLVRAFKDPTNSHLEDKDILKILTVSSKCHLEALYKHCKRIGAEPLVLFHGLPSFSSQI